MSKALYKPLGMVASIVGGVMASYVFKRVWRLVAHEEEPPRATDKQSGWGEALVAAGVQGLIFGVVKAAVDRAGAAGVAKVTRDWPEDSDEGR